MDIEWAKDSDEDKCLVKNKLEELEPGFAIDLVDLIEQNRRTSSVNSRILQLRID